MSTYETAFVNISEPNATPGYVRVSAIVAIAPTRDSRNLALGFRAIIELNTGTQWRSPLTVEEIIARLDEAVKLAAKVDSGDA